MLQLLYCRGEMVDQIVESSCSRYIEFKAVTGIFSYSYNTIEQVIITPTHTTHPFGLVRNISFNDAFVHWSAVNPPFGPGQFTI